MLLPPQGQPVVVHQPQLSVVQPEAKQRELEITAVALLKKLVETQTQIAQLQNAASIREQRKGNESPEPNYSPLHRPNIDEAAAANHELKTEPATNVAAQQPVMQQQVVNALQQMVDDFPSSPDLVYSPVRAPKKGKKPPSDEEEVAWSGDDADAMG